MFVVLIATVTLVGLIPVRIASADERATQRAMEQQRKAVEAEMRRQAEYERKMVEQQQRMMQEQMKAQQRMFQEQQRQMQQQAAAQAQAQARAMQNQAKATQAQQRAFNSTSAVANRAKQAARPAHVTTTATTTPTYHAYRPYYGHHTTTHYYHRTTYRTYRSNSNQTDPETRALLRLKSSLDSVRMGTQVTQTHTNAIKRGLMGVVEVPRVPTIAAINQLSSNLATGLANRTSPQAQTGPMALTLRAVMNSPAFAVGDFNDVVNEHRGALRTSKFRPADVTSVMESIRTIASQTRIRR
jgi:membrane-associated HD superfamily phosphohydrolase